ncbi:MAG: hypothetical protein ABIZ81_16585, partial [Opitutaceae bacterium]
FSRAAAADTYQVTGPIVALTASTITVQKGDEKWEIARDPALKSDGNLKVGERVTIHYRMTATKVEPNPGKAGTSKAADGSESRAPASKKKSE